MSAASAWRTAVLIAIVAVAAQCLAADVPAPVQCAVQRLEKFADVSADAITVVSYEPVDWPDTSLGAPREGRMYLQVITPGYKVILETGGQQYEYHTDMERRVVLAKTPDEPAQRESAPADDSPVGLCVQDLAKRLSISAQDITVVKAVPVAFPDSSLGLPYPGEAYMQVITPGQWVVLEANRAQHLYAVAKRHVRYAGPADSWHYSALYIEPIPNEPNLNGTLMQVSLIGSNPVRLFDGACEVYPQPNGKIIAKRRTSRSGHELILIDPKDLSDTPGIAAAFDFADAVISPDGTQWAAIMRSMVGAEWKVMRGKVGESAGGGRGGGLLFAGADIPAGGAPQKLYWIKDNPVLGLGTYPNASYYELLPDNTWKKAGWFMPPQDGLRMLNKSETLQIRQVDLDGTPGVKVSRMWFTGNDRPIATIADLTMIDSYVSPQRRFAFVSGTSNDQLKGVTVDMLTGQVLPTVSSSMAPPVFLEAPPLSRPRLEGLFDTE